MPGTEEVTAVNRPKSLHWDFALGSRCSRKDAVSKQDEQVRYMVYQTMAALRSHRRDGKGRRGEILCRAAGPISSISHSFGCKWQECPPEQPKSKRLLPTRGTECTPGVAESRDLNSSCEMPSRSASRICFLQAGSSSGRLMGSVTRPGPCPSRSERRQLGPPGRGPFRHRSEVSL